MTSVSSMPTRAKVFEATVAVFRGTNPQFYDRADPDLGNAGPLGKFGANVGYGSSGTNSVRIVEANWNISKDSTDLGYVSVVLEGDMVLGSFATKKILADSGVSID